MNPPFLPPRDLLRSLFDAAIAAADPALCLPPYLPPQLPAAPTGRTLVVGAGKAAAAMARAVEDHWIGALCGLVVTRYGHGVPCRRIEVLEAAHPVPDAAGQAAAARMLASVRGLTPDDLVLALISGGGSALMALPAPGITLADKQAVNRALLNSGATIAEMNCVRKHLSAIKGGRLALAAWPARVLTLAISDVPGDDPAVIASGPTLPDATTAAEALAVLERYRIDIAPAVRRLLTSPAGETPKPGDARFARSEVRIIATAKQALTAAAEAARRAGIAPLILGDAIEGEAREVAMSMAETARLCANGSGPVAPPCVLLSGGETSVTLRGVTMRENGIESGRGGRNTEFLLALSLALDGQAGIYAIACDTDGIDGTEDNAGALLAPDSVLRAQMAGIDVASRLAAHDAYSVFAALGDLVVTGPTLTNVNDFRAILVMKGKPPAMNEHG